MTDDKDAKSDKESKEDKKPSNFRSALIKLIIASLVAVVTYSIVEPLKSVTKNYIWPEYMELTESVNAIVGVPQGYQFSLVNKSSIAGISGGTIEFHHEGSALEIVGQNKFIFAASDESITVPSDQKLSLVAHTEGIHQLNAAIETQRGSNFNGVISIQTRPRILITQRDYSGVWHVVLNGVEGTMTVVQRTPPDRHFGGTIELQDGRVLQILEGASRWDGRTIIIWAKDSSGDEYNIQSLKCRVEIDNTFWVFAHGDFKVTDEDSNLIPIEYQAPTYVEECPGVVEFPPRQQSGSFFARVESR